MHLPPLVLGKIIRSEKSIAFLDFELPDKLVALGTLKSFKTYCCISPYFIHYALTYFVEDVLKITPLVHFKKSLFFNFISKPIF